MTNTRYFSRNSRHFATYPPFQMVVWRYLVTRNVRDLLSTFPTIFAFNGPERRGTTIDDSHFEVLPMQRTRDTFLGTADYPLSVVFPDIPGAYLTVSRYNERAGLIFGTPEYSHTTLLERIDLQRNLYFYTTMHGIFETPDCSFLDTPLSGRLYFVMTNAQHLLPHSRQWFGHEIGIRRVEIAETRWFVKY